MRTAIIIILVILLIAAAYYFLVMNKNKPVDGSACSTVAGGPKNGTLISGVCVADKIPISQIPFNPNALKKFNVGDNVFLNPNAAAPATQDGIPVYRAPIQNSAGTYLIGVVRPEWYMPNAIGKYSSDAGSGWSKVSVQNLQLWEFQGKYTTVLIYITQDVFFRNSDIQKTPY